MNIRRYTLVVLVLLALLIAGSLAAAQDTETDDDFIIVSGIISFDDDGSILLTDEDGNVYIIAPAGAFNPSEFEDGDEVEIVGYMLPDGTTIHTLSLEPYSGDPDEGDDPDDPDEGDDPDDPDEGEEPEEPIDPNNAFFCANDGEFLHPVAAAIADEFEDAGVTYDDILAMHCESNLGFGEISRALVLAKLAIENGDLEEGDILTLLQARADGSAWKDLLDEYDIHPSDLAPGLVIRNQAGGRPEDAGQPEGAGRPEDPGPPDGAGRPEDPGPPDGAGRPEDPGPPDGAGRPEDPGPPDGAGRPENPGPPSNPGPPAGRGGGRGGN